MAASSPVLARRCPLRHAPNPAPSGRACHLARGATSVVGMDTTPRSLADWLRARSDDDLATLLEGRPDLAVPVPSDIGVLSARGTVLLSVLRALERLDRFGLDLIDALTLLDEPAS